jgi:oligoendopeptidase F
VGTLAHEMGHAMNSYYSNKAQPYYYSDIPTFNAEIASTTNETLLLKTMLANAKDDNEKLYFLNEMAENIRRTFFAQVMYADFEKQIHQRVDGGDALSVDSLNKMWGDTMKRYYGPDFELDDIAKVGWARVPHFYLNFYVYQYATGIAASNQFVKNISENKEGAVDKYITFLSSGSMDYPVALLKTAGVDMLSPAPVDNLLTDFGKIVGQMEELLKKQGKIK